MTAPLKGISSMATSQLLKHLAEAYEAETGQEVAIESVGGVDAAKRVADGEIFDFAVLASNAIDKLFDQAVLMHGSKRDFVCSTTAVAVRAGAAAPSIESEASLRKLIESSTAVGYSTGPSGVAILELLARWSITNTSTTPRLVQAKPGTPVGQMIAAGDVTIGFQQMSELINIPGIQVVGPMPPGLEIETIFAGAICKSSSAPDSAQQFLHFLCAPQADTQKRLHGMEPV